MYKIFYTKLVEQAFVVLQIKNLENQAKIVVVIGDFVRLVIFPD